jgi:peptidoglycan LD-endopeptidase CwlK
MPCYLRRMAMDARSEKNLVGVHSALVGVVRRAAEIVEARHDGLGFIVTEGLRTKERQAELLKAGASRTMNTKHLTGRAVDLAATVNGEVRWYMPLYANLATAMKLAADEQGVQIVWGGSWRTFKDGPHFELAEEAFSA